MSPIPCFIGSVASIGGGSFLAGFNGSGVSLVEVLFPCRVQWFGRVIGGRFYSLAGVNGLGVSPLYCFPLQVRAVVAMVKFSHLINFVLNKKLGCIIQNCSLGGCPLSPASSARWLPLVGGSFLAGVNGLGVSLVAVLFPCRVQWFGCVF